MLRRSLVIAALVTVFVGTARAQTAADTASIVAVSKDYIDGYWEGDSVRMRRALHPALAKRQVLGRAGTGSTLSELTAERLVASVGRGGGSRTPVAERRSEIRILHIFGNMATVLIDAGQWVDYVHLARWNGEYKIINILFDFRRH